MNLWGWYMRDAHAAYTQGDRERIAMIEAFEEASPLMRKDPDQALALMDQAHAIARRLNENWWMRFFEHWRLQMLLHYKRDYQAALELAIRAAVEVRKPGYEQFPQRICLHEDLITAYAGIDPIGNQQRIQQALDYMQGEVSPRMQCRSCLQGLRVQFQTELGRLDHALDQALESGLEALAINQHEPHHLMWAYNHLCEIAYLRGDWENLLGWALAGEELADSRDRADNMIEFLAWQAVCRRHAGDEAAAQRLYRRATSRAGRLAVEPGRAYFDALCAYHELAGSYHLALKVRDRQRAILADTGQTYFSAQCLLERCALLRRMGKPLDAAIAEARALIGQLSNPAPLLARLAELTS
jgi:hypothetical protein